MDVTAGMTREEVTPVIDFGIVLSGVDMSLLGPILARIELSIINSELEEIIEQSRATRHALSLQQADKQILASRAEDLKDSLDNLKSRRKDLERVSSFLVIEEVVDKLNSMKQKLTKLQEIKGTLDRDVFKEQHQKITSEIKRLKSMAKDEMKRLQRWLKEIKKVEKELRKASSKIEARYKIGDISMQAYDLSMVENKRQSAILKRTRLELDEIIVTTRKSIT
jgi:DNA repair exonuclease SbcCD ATPase subunit